MPLGINSIVGAGIHRTGERGKAMPPVGETAFLQVPTSSSLEESSSTSHMYLTFYSDINSVVGAYHYPLLIGMGNKDFVTSVLSPSHL